MAWAWIEEIRAVRSGKYGPEPDCSNGRDGKKVGQRVIHVLGGPDKILKAALVGGYAAEVLLGKGDSRERVPTRILSRGILKQGLAIPG